MNPRQVCCATQRLEEKSSKSVTQALALTLASQNTMKVRETSKHNKQDSP